MEEDQDLEDNYDESDEVICMTAADMLQKLQEAWLNERMAPELLDSHEDLVECMIEQLNTMENNLRTGKRSALVNSIHRLEMERVKYVISSFIRCRLNKIEKYAVEVLRLHTARAHDEPALLSSAELEYAKEYSDYMESHMKSMVLRSMPTNLQNFDEAKELPKPDLNKYVFIRVNDEQDQVLVDEDDAINLEKDAQHILRYQYISSLLSDGSVSLI